MRIASRACSFLFASALLLGGPVGCGSGNGATPGDAGSGTDGGGLDEGGTTDGGLDGDRDGGPMPDSGAPVVCPAMDAGSPAGYPAAHAPFPTVAFGGGRLITEPEVVTVTWPGDPYASKLETFGDQLTQSCWWDAVRASYCSGSNCIQRGKVPAKPHVRLTSPPASSYTDSAQGGASTMKAFIQQQVASGTFPAPSANTIYVLYFPSSVTTSLDGQTMCQTVGGWHNDAMVTPPGGATVDVAFAAVGECSFPGFGAQPNEITFSASHEISEAASDTGGRGYYIAHNTNDELPWEIFGGGEIGDLCVDQIGPSEPGGMPVDRDTLMLPGGTFTAQRIWSVNAAAAGGDPCVPLVASEDPYFNVAIAKGSGLVQVAVGSSVTFEADAFSTGPTSWTVAGIDASELQGGPAYVQITTDKVMVTNGDKVMVTAKLAMQPPMLGGGISGMPYVLISQSGSKFHMWPGIVVAQ